MIEENEIAKTLMNMKKAYRCYEETEKTAREHKRSIKEMAREITEKFAVKIGDDLEVFPELEGVFMRHTYFSQGIGVLIEHKNVPELIKVLKRWGYED